MAKIEQIDWFMIGKNVEFVFFLALIGKDAEWSNRFLLLLDLKMDLNLLL
jgi:hypothetical protein